MAPRRRIKTRTLPNGIKLEQLPSYVYFDRTGAGRWIWRRYDPQTKRCATVRLCGPKATLSEIWSAFEAVAAEKPDNTLTGLTGAFTASSAWSGLSEATRRDYNQCAAAILATKTRDGRAVRDVPLASWTPGTIRSYMDRRAETSVSRANHELRFLRRLFAWAYERDVVTTNPAKGVKIIPEPSRKRYVTDEEYLASLQHAATSGYGYIVVVAELAYLCRLRLAEVLDLKRADMRQDGLYSARRKGGKDAVTAWSPRLQEAVKGALSLHGRLSSVYLIPGKSGGRLVESTVQTAWQRLMTSWEGERFRLHDLKRKGVSDAKDDKLTASGHRSLAMLKVYDVLPLQAKPTR